MAKKVTIYDIADKLLLSPSTVSRALADNSLITEKTRLKVKKAAIEMGYMEDPKQVEEANMIAVVIPEINSYFYSSILASMQAVIRDKYLLSVMCSNNSSKIEKEIVSKLSPSQIKCLIISQSMDTEDCSHLVEAEKRGIKIILFNRIYYTGKCPKFLMDDYMDSYNLASHLISTGRRRIAFAAKHFNCPIYKNRVQAYKDVLKKHNIPFNPEYLIYSELTLKDTHEIITRFINMNPRPEAIILPSFISSLQAKSIAKLYNLSIPQDIAIVSFDEDPECRYSTPSITSIEQPVMETGEEIANAALQLCDGTSKEKDSIRIFSSNLIIRGSSFSC
jgi:LacI family transcriptional regulator